MRIKSTVGTAYHEAGHAVMALAKGIRFKDVTIIPDKKRGSLGNIMWVRSFPRRKDADYTSRTLLKRGTITLAGICAEKIYSGSYEWDGFGDDDGRSDRTHAIEYFIRAGVLDVTEYFGRTETLLRKHWPKVEAVAAALLDRKTLQYAEVRELINF